MDEGSGSLPTSEFSFSMLIEEVLDFYREAAAVKGIRLNAVIQPDVMLRANRESIVQLLSVLLDNAVQYAPADGSIRVVLTKEKSGSYFKRKTPSIHRRMEIWNGCLTVFTAATQPGHRRAEDMVSGSPQPGQWRRRTAAL